MADKRARVWTFLCFWFLLLIYPWLDGTPRRYTKSDGDGELMEPHNTDGIDPGGGSSNIHIHDV